MKLAALLILLGIAANVALWWLNAWLPVFHRHCEVVGYCAPR